MIRLLVGFFLMAGGVGGIEQNTDMFPSVCFASCRTSIDASLQTLKNFRKIKKSA